MYKIRGGDGKEYGPVTAEQVQQWVRENRLNGQSLVQSAEGGDWKPLTSFPEFASLFPTVATPTPSPGGPPPVPTTPSPTVTAAPQADKNVGAPTRVTKELPTYLVPAILSTILCCPPFGIPAIVYASQVSSKLAAGNIEGAEIASRNARTWFWVSIGVGIIAQIVSWLVIAATFAKVGPVHL